MTDPEPMATLERSLRDGPADELGYRAQALDLGTDPTGSSVGVARGSRRMRPLLSYADAVAILLVVLVAGFLVVQRLGGVGAGPQATSAPIPALTETFVSTRNGFSVRYPSGWSTKPATTSWRPATYLPVGNSALDELMMPGEARLVVASQRLANGQTEAAWLASFSQPYDLGACSGDRSAWPRVTVDGHVGYLDLQACPFPADAGFSRPDVAFDAIVFAGGRVYEIGLDGAISRAYFEAFLATVHLDPGSAIDPPEGS